MPLAPLLFAAAALNLISTLQTGNTTASLRGLSVPSAQNVWASGTAGTYLRTTDAGLHWQAAKVPGAETLDFRDVQAFDDKTALLLASGPGQASRVYKTTDSGGHWALVLQNTDPKGFFDSFAFWDRRHGILVGDPVAGLFTIFVTDDAGNSWTRAMQPPALEGEGAFAASGTCITVHGAKTAWFGTGGVNVSRVFYTSDRGKTWTAAITPLDQAVPSAGVFSLVFRDQRTGFAVGGDYRKPTDPSHTLGITGDGGKTWAESSIPGGYRSAIMRTPKFLLAVGTSGADLSHDNGKSWQTFAIGNFNAVAGAGENIWAVGPKGIIAKLSISLK